MCAMSPGERVCSKIDSTLSINQLQSSTLVDCLRLFNSICRSCYGPYGRLKMIHNNNGGHITLTSCSKRLFQTLNVSKPVLKLLTAALTDHSRFNCDGTLFVAVLTTDIILNVIDKNESPRLTIEIHDNLLKKCEEYMESISCPTKGKARWESTTPALSIVRSILNSKPGSMLSDDDGTAVSNLLLQTFLGSFASHMLQEKTDPIHYLELPGKPASESYLVHGLMFQAPQVAPYGSLPPLKYVAAENGKYIRTALFCCSLAGDSEEFDAVSYELGPSTSIEDSVLINLLDVANKLINDEVGLLACQKVVHPAVKKLMRQNGVMVVDRLGLTFINSFHKLSGGRVFRSIQASLTETSYGKVSEIKHRVIQDKSYLNIIGDGNTVIKTLVLMNASVESLAELKVQCETVFHSLRTLLVEPSVLCGGGCWQTNLALHMLSKSSEHVEEIVGRFGSSEQHTRTVVENFCSSLLRCAKHLISSSDQGLVDVRYGHLWMSDKGQDNLTEGMQCQCKAVSYVNGMNLESLVNVSGRSSAINLLENLPGHRTPEVCDVYRSSVNGLRNSIAISNMIIGIDQFIIDEN